MSITFESYYDTDGNIASIRQHKYCSSFELIISDIYGSLIWKRIYMSRHSAKRAMKAAFPGMISY